MYEVGSRSMALDSTPSGIGEPPYMINRRLERLVDCSFGCAQIRLIKVGGNAVAVGFNFSTTARNSSGVKCNGICGAPSSGIAQTAHASTKWNKGAECSQESCQLRPSPIAESIALTVMFS